MMKKGNMTILASIFIMALVAAGVGAGTMAYFSDKATDPVRFKSGTLKIQVYDYANGLWKDNIIETTVLADNIAPGYTKTVTYAILNAGDVPIKSLAVDMECWGGAQLLGYMWMERNSYWIPNKAGITATPGGCPQQLLTDYCEGTWFDFSHTDDSDDMLYWLNTVLEPGEVLYKEYTFVFRELEFDQSDAMGQTVTIKLSFEARSN